MGCPGCKDEKKELLALVEQLRASNARLAAALDVAADTLGKVEAHVTRPHPDLGPSLLESQRLQESAHATLSEPNVRKEEDGVDRPVQRDMWAVLRYPGKRLSERG